MKEIYTAVTEFFNHPFFIIMGGLMTLLMILGFLFTLYLVVRGVFPVWYRLGIGLSKRRIALFASSAYPELSCLLAESKIFSSKNIVQINKMDLARAEKETIFLVHWKDYGDKIDEILARKKDSTALIVYAPQSEGRIESADIDKINSHRNAVVVNFRGRLLNDILTSLITTSYERK